MWKFGSLLVILLLAACQTPKKAAAQKPNILFLFADDQRADALGLGKNPYLQTPHIDALAAEGVHFENCYVMGGAPRRHMRSQSGDADEWQKFVSGLRSFGWGFNPSAVFESIWISHLWNGQMA
ncbi:sulfatase-like hydrolase/transferase [Flavobacteriaceae bacterium]|nr:sulfatase-like hydrolase/transferase [Flavobacteriaceae bacterium]